MIIDCKKIAAPPEKSIYKTELTNRQVVQGVTGQMKTKIILILLLVALPVFAVTTKSKYVGYKHKRRSLRGKNCRTALKIWAAGCCPAKI